jgi:hypothetical protein
MLFWVSLILVACLVLSEISILSSRVQANPSKQLSLTTSKHKYADGETVTIYLKNIGTETVRLNTIPWFGIFDSTGHQVYPGLYQYVVTYIEPDEILTDQWDQKDADTGQYVPRGSYTVLANSELIVEPYAEFIIQDVRNPAPSRNGYRYPDQGSQYEPWVEWWYFRLAAPNAGNFFFAYYVVNPWDTGSLPLWENTGAYVCAGMYNQAEDTKVNALDKYNVADFSAKEELCNVTIHDQANSALTVTGGQEYGDSIRIQGSLRPSSTFVEGKILGHNINSISKYTWDLTFTQVLGLDTSNHPLEPSIFGWLIYMTEARMSVGGTINITTDQTTQTFRITSVDAQQWKGYQDHNWGKSFPEIWIWGHCVKDQSFSIVLGWGGTGEIVGMGRLGLNLTHGYIQDTDFLFFSPVSGDDVSVVLSNWVLYTDEGGTWLVPTRYDFQARNTGSYPQYKVNVTASWSTSQIERLPLPRQVGNMVFNDFEQLGVSLTVNIFKKNGQATPWLKIDKGDLITTNGGAEYGRRQHGRTVRAYCYTEGKYVSVNIEKDGTPTDFNTPHTFVLAGTHTFSVPSTDAAGHPFTKWSTGILGRTITTASNETFTAYYGTPPPCVGGVIVPVDKFGLLAPYIGLASTIIVTTAATAIYVRRVRRRKEKQ